VNRSVLLSAGNSVHRVGDKIVKLFRIGNVQQTFRVNAHPAQKEYVTLCTTQLMRRNVGQRANDCALLLVNKDVIQLIDNSAQLSMNNSVTQSLKLLMNNSVTQSMSRNATLSMKKNVITLSLHMEVVMGDMVLLLHLLADKSQDRNVGMFHDNSAEMFLNRFPDNSAEMYQDRSATLYLKKSAIMYPVRNVTMSKLRYVIMSLER